MNKNYFVIILLGIFSLGCISSAHATNHQTSIFANSLNQGYSNSYKDPVHGFSITPPPNWTLVKNIPDKISNNTIAIFSNNDKDHLSTFVIFYRPIPQNVTNAINKYTDNDILYSVAQELSGSDPDSKTITLKGAVERYVDGVRVATITSTTYIKDNSTSTSENVMYFLSGQQYTFILTTKPDYFDKNSALFERSVNSFLVNQTSIKNQQLLIPSWIKNNAKWWSENSLSDSDFIKGIQYLISNGMMKIPQTQYGPHQPSGIPSWIKNNAKWWSEGQISDDEFVKGIQYLISNGIITV